MLFRSAIPLTVSRVYCCSEFNTFNVKLSVITVCLTVIFNIVGPRNHLKTVCAIHRLRVCKHCYHSMYFPVVVWSPSVTCLALHKTYVGDLLRLYPKTHIVTTFLCLFIVRANISNLIDVRLVTDICHALE